MSDLGKSMKKIKICHLTSAHDSYDVRIFQKECTFIAKDERFEVTLIAPGESRLENNVNVIGIGAKPSSRFERMFSFTKKVYKEAIKVDADIYHFHDPELLKVGYSLKKIGKKVVFDSHEFTYQQIKIKEYIPKLLRWFVSEIYLRFETKVCKAIDGVIAPADYEGENLFSDRCNNFAYANNTPILEEFASVNEDVAWDDKKYDCCHIGSLTKSRGITKLLEAIKDEDIRLALGGDFSPETYKDELMAAGLIGDNVTLLGNCNRHKVVDTYKNSRIGVSTILNVGQYYKLDNLPTKVYEYMAMGMPMVISDTPYTVKLNAKEQFGITVSPDSSEQIKSALKELLENRDLSQQLGETGKKLSKLYFNWEMEVENIKELYTKILGE